MNKRVTIVLLLCTAAAIAVVIFDSHRPGWRGPRPRSRLSFYWERIQWNLAARKANRQRQQYFGTVRDQSNDPVSGVAISFSIHRLNADAVGGIVTSGRNGDFSITNQIGLDLELYKFEKPGYKPQIWSSAVRNPAKLPNSPSNRTVINMWKLNGPEELIIVTGEYRIKPNTGPVRIDLTKGRTVDTGGDLIIDVQRSKTQTNRLAPFDWSYALEPVNGGIQETDESHYYNLLTAPADGYKPKFEHRVLASDQRPMGQDTRFFLVTSRNQQVFSKLWFTIYANEFGQPASANFYKSVANPNSSPNWEEDPANMHLPK